MGRGGPVGIAAFACHGFGQHDAIAIDNATTLDRLPGASHTRTVPCHEGDKLGIAEASQLPDRLMDQDRPQRQQTEGRQHAIGTARPAGETEAAYQLPDEHRRGQHEGDAQQHNRAIQQGRR